MEKEKIILMAIIIILVSKCNLALAGYPGTFKWESPIGLIKEDPVSIYSSPAIDTDGTVYIGGVDGNLYAIYPDGSLKWKYRIGEEIYSSPAIGTDGTVYIGSDDYNLYAINPDGDPDDRLKWSFKTRGLVDSSPAIGIDGTVYVGSLDGKVYAIYPDGSLKWSFKTGGDVDSSPAIGSDGIIYIGSNDGYLCAINPDGDPDDRLKWKCLIEDWVYLSSPAIGPDSTIYVGSEDNKLYAIDPNGNKKWSFETAGSVYSSPVIGPDGTVYAGSLGGNVCAINPDGSLKWGFQTESLFDSSPAIGSDGTVYIGNVNGNLYAIDPNGKLSWNFDTGCPVYSSPAIDIDGTIYTTGNQSLLAIHSGSYGLADNSWPMFLHDARHTGRIPLIARMKTMNIPEGWSMISLPVDPVNKKLSVLFPNGVTVYGYEDGTGYKRVSSGDSLEAGKGYWILSKKAMPYTIIGQPFTRYSLLINRNGWLMIGGCSSTAQASVTNGSIVNIYGYELDSGYEWVQNSANLMPGQGYWILLKDITGQAELTVGE